MEENQVYQDDKDKLFMMTLDTFMYTKRIMLHKEANNKIDKKFASVLFDAVSEIESFLADVEIVQNEGETDKEMNDLIASVDSSVLQLHHYYFCRACKQSVKSSRHALHEHFVSLKHLKNLRILSSRMKNEPSKESEQLAEHDGSTQSLNGIESQTGKSEIVRKERQNSLPAKIDNLLKTRLPKKLGEILTFNLESITMQLSQEASAVQKSGKHIRVCDMLRKRLIHRYPNIKVFPFGSFITGLGSEKTDLDIFIDTQNCFYMKLSKRQMKEAIYETQRILASSRDQWCSFEPIVHARTPILRVFCNIEKIDCDLSFSNGLSTVNTALVSYLSNLQPICKKLVLFVKFWAMKLSLGTNSYLLTLLVIFYLQQELALPSVSFLQGLVAPRYIDDWNTAFATPNLQQLKIQVLTDFRRYLIGFFFYYGFQFDYTNYMVCPLTGTRVLKHIFDHGKEKFLPTVFTPFVKYMSKINLHEADEIEDLFANYKPLVIQDPFDLSHNVSKGIQEQKLLKMIHMMRCSYEVLTKPQP